MLSKEEFTEKSLAVLKWLVAIPSISGTAGDDILMHTIFNTVSEFTYFKNHPQYLSYITHNDQKNHSFTAFVRRDATTTKTIVFLCNTDTSSNETFGTIKAYAFKSDEIKEKLKTLQLSEKELKALDDENNIYGLGVFANKAPIAALLIMIKYFTERLWELPLNILFVCNSESLNGNEGIRTCLPYINNLVSTHNIELTLSVCFRPEPKDDSTKHINLYTANMGKVEAGFYIFGEGTSIDNPYHGFSPTLIASKIVEEMELNPTLTKDLSKRAIVPTFNYMHNYNNRSPITPDMVHLSFNFPFINFNILDLLENLKQIAAHALQRSAEIIEDRKNIFRNINEFEFNSEVREAEVLSFADFFYRASLHYKGNLKSAVEGLIQKSLNEEQSYQTIIKNIIERINELARLPRPSVIIFFGNDFIPQQQLRRNNAQDRELYISINKAAEEFNKRNDNQINIENECSSNSNCFIRPVGIDVALKALKDECPMPISTFYNLNAPGITMSYNGDGLYQAYEHVDKTFFGDMLSFINLLMIELGPDDPQEYLHKTEDKALEVLNVSMDKAKEESTNKKNIAPQDHKKNEESQDRIEDYMVENAEPNSKSKLSDPLKSSDNQNIENHSTKI